MAAQRGPLEPEFDPIPLPSVVNLDSVESVAISTLVDRLGMLSDRTMRAVCEAMSIALDFR
jgi:mRNA interferase MazF